MSEFPVLPKRFRSLQQQQLHLEMQQHWFQLCGSTTFKFKSDTKSSKSCQLSVSSWESSTYGYQIDLKDYSRTQILMFEMVN